MIASEVKAARDGDTAKGGFDSELKKRKDIID